MLLISSIVIYAQEDVTKFLGIPVDGSKSEMIQKLKAKGYTSSQHNKDILVGEFNGTDVNIHIATNNNKVCRIMVCDANNIDERSIQIRFNKLCEQFKNNSKYLSLEENQTISEDEDIFYQKTDTIAVAKMLMSALSPKYTTEQLANPTEELQSEMVKLSIEYLMKRPVWFMISDFQGKYYITMYYDNEYNRANGEDL